MKERSPTPFKKEFKQEPLGAGGFATVREFENDPRWVIKEIRHGKLETNISEAKQAIEAANEYLSEYIPKNKLVVGKNEHGRTKLFIVQEKITGKDLYDVLYLTNPKERDPMLKKLEKVIDDFFSRVVEMYMGSFNQEKGTGLVPDLGSTNMVIGSREGEAEEGVYFVDLYPVAYVEPDGVLEFIKDKADMITGSVPLQMPKFRENLKKLDMFVKRHLKLS